MERLKNVLEGEHSHVIPVTSGGPLKSVLGPLIFLIFINDLPCHVKTMVRLFANDTVIYLTIKSENDFRQIQDDLHSLENGNQTGVCNLIQALSATLYG